MAGVTFSMDAKRLERALRDRLKSSRKDPDTLVRQAVAVFSFIAAKLTPPTDGKNSLGSWGEQKRRGEMALQRDLRKIMVPVSHDLVGSIRDGQFRFVGKLGAIRYVVAIDHDLTHASVGDLARLHRSFRNKRGRVRDLRSAYRNRGNGVTEILRFVVSKTTFDAYEAHEMDQVGKGKAGWIAVHRAAGGKGRFPGFVSRHQAKVAGQHRYQMSRVGESAVFIDVGNMVPHIQEAGRAAHVIRTALAYTANNFERQLRHWIKKQGGPIAGPMRVGPTFAAVDTIIDI